MYDPSNDPLPDGIDNPPVEAPPRLTIVWDGVEVPSDVANDWRGPLGRSFRIGVAAGRAVAPTEYRPDGGGPFGQRHNL